MAIPQLHQQFIDRAVPILSADQRLIGVAAAGSYAAGDMDEWSDIDLVIVATDDDYSQVMDHRKTIAGKLGDLVAAFTGEHVGEPRLLICLYDQPVLHVDLKFTTIEALRDRRVDDPVVLWERDGRVADALRASRGAYPPLDFQWVEDRFWIWIHYLAIKLGRGELFEAIDGLSFIRITVLSPMAKQLAGHDPRGVRRVEHLIPTHLPSLCSTIATRHDRREVARAAEAMIDFYLQLRKAAGSRLVPNQYAEVIAREFLRKTITA
jgi:predicted nucleotidyltransferase